MIKPFLLDNIKKISGREVALVKALYEYLPETDVRERLHVDIHKTLAEHLGQGAQYSLSSIETKSGRDFLAQLPEYSVFAVISLAPFEKKVLVQIDHAIANTVINKLLGEEESGGQDLRPLTETEQGVLQYLFMQILSRIHELGGNAPRAHFRFDKFLFDSAGISEYVSAKEFLCAVTLDASVSNQTGFVKILFPDPVLMGVEDKSQKAGRTAAEKKFLEKQISRVGFVKTTAWAEAGRSQLTISEIGQLEEGDVILFDDSYVKVKGNTVSGDVFIHFGEMEGGVRSGLESVTDKKITCKLENIVK